MIQKILITQPRPLTDHNPFSAMEKHYGVQFDFRPLIHVEGLSANEFRMQHIQPQNYTAVVLSSKLGAEHYFRLLDEMHIKINEDTHYYCISEAVAMYLTKFIVYRKRKVFYGENNKFEELVPFANRHKEDTFLFVTSEVHSDEPIQMFADNGIEVTPAVMYRTVADCWPEKDPFDYDMLVLMTPASVQSIRQNFPNFQQGNTVIACFGAGTLQAAEEAGWQVQIKAPTPQFPGIAAAIEHWLESL